MDLESALIASTGVGAAAAFASGYAVQRWRRSRLDAAALREAVAREADLPRSLHPVIDPDICIGSLSCLKGCPEGDILGIVDGAAALLQGQHCVGHGRCAAACPVGAIQLVFGTARRGVDLPEVSEHYESSRPGVYVVGELGGMGLIKNALRQGLSAAGHIAENRAGGDGDAVDAVVVGAGPAGIATALGLLERGLSYRLLEQETVGGSVAHYPRRKVVMTEKVELPFHGIFGKPRISKEALLATLQKVIRKSGLAVEEGVKVVGVDGQDGDFTVQTTGGPVRARKVVLAVGRRGSPRKLGVPGEELPKVVYRLIEPEQYADSAVLVVGGGDAGVEAACQLARESNARVWLSYRGEAPKCREPNRRELEELAGAGRVRVLARSSVKRIAEREVDLEVGGKPVRISNDHVIVNAGGELPTDFLKAVGVAMRRYHGEAPGSRPGATRSHPLQSEAAARRRARRLGILFAVLGASVLAWLAWKGWDYYLLQPVLRLRSPLHAALKPAGPWGHGVGIAATAFMLSNFLYAARKRTRWMQGLGHMRSWLAFHVFVGSMSPLVIAFHAAFQSRNLLASATAAALAVVVLTGIVGRYIYGLVPAASGKALEIEEVRASLEQARAEAEPLLESARDPAPLRRLLAAVTAPLPPVSLLRAVARLPFEVARYRLVLWRVGKLFRDRKARRAFRDDVLALEKLRLQASFFGSLKSLMRAWRILHASLAVFLVLAIAVHIGVALYLGYGLKVFVSW
ncbi:MAG TPA: NAD(P)-binding domain-containing protein [Anaeromyxobacteraceae bacterium]|nr:NAD(P)-binding domain-containing protein [Anaeromyxobacteraceae bacterium]